MGVGFHINGLCVLGSIVASQKWGACRLCIKHVTVFNDLLQVHRLIQVDSVTFAGYMHSEEPIWFSEVSALPFAHELCLDRINYGLVRAQEDYPEESDGHLMSNGHPSPKNKPRSRRNKGEMEEKSPDYIPSAQCQI